MPIDPKGSAGPSSRRCSLRERLTLERKMLHRLALPGREFADGRIEHFGTADLECCLLGDPRSDQNDFDKRAAHEFRVFEFDRGGAARPSHAAGQWF